MSTRDLIRATAPELADLDDAVIDLAVRYADERCDPEAFGVRYQQAIVYLACHLLTLRQRQAAGLGGAGPVAAVKTGELQVTYGAVAGVVGTDAQLATTSYGVEFLTIRRQCLVSPRLY